MALAGAPDELARAGASGAAAVACLDWDAFVKPTVAAGCAGTGEECEGE